MYLGNQPLSASFLTDYFSGNGTTVAFTLSRAPVSASSVVITISGVKQAASTYGVSGTTLTFSAAPPSGTNNIEVLHLGVQPDTVVQPSYRTITEFTATAGQTSFSPASYTVGFIDVFRNGVKLGTADFTATNGTSVVLNNACAAGDLVRFEGFLITSFNNAIPNTAGAVGASLLATGAAATNIGSGGVTQSMLANNVVSTGPAFLASCGALSVPASTFTKMPFSSKTYDTNNNYDASTNYRFTPTVAGYYWIKIQYFLGVSTGRTAASIYKNGSDVCQTLVPSSNTNGGISVVSQGLVYFNGTTDYVEAYAYQESAGAASINTSANLTFFQGYMVRAA